MPSISSIPWNIQYFTECNDITGWTNSGTTIVTTDGSPAANCINAAGLQYCYIQPTGLTTLTNKTITFNVKVLSGATNQLCNFFFGTNSAGAGQMLRLDGRATQFSNFSSTTTWATWASPTTGGVLALNTWYSIKIQINASNSASWYLNGTLQSSGYACTMNGGYIACHGDASTVAGGRYDQICIYQGLV